VFSDPDEDKRSFTAESVKTASETDSMAEYGDGETGRFTEDGSFIGALVFILVTSVAVHPAFQVNMAA